ncbi:SDR family oxidoreductase [Burkholderia sp. 22PA0099]|uniref:SDR family oxidoreductase n=1 Tax=Burkholderia sp. 22PA0099 TaxID=3237372 RepID=UPI0039C2BCC7
MKVLVCGANGTIGRAICERLAAHGHDVIAGVRAPRRAGDIAIDYRSDHDVAAWLPRIAEVDAVVNAVGILTERGGQRFDAVHRAAPVALFEACRAAGGRRIVQISALGAEAGATPFLRSKRDADHHLLAMPGDALVARPALVFDPAGHSTRLFAALASLPLHLLPDGGRQRLRPVHRDDLAELVVRWLERGTPGRESADVVGGREVSYGEMLAIYRAALGGRPARSISVPGALVGAAAAAIGRLPGAMLDRDTWTMLANGNTASAGGTTRLLGRRPLGLPQGVAGADVQRLRAGALAAIRQPLLRGALAFVWLWTAWVSAFVFPREASLARLGAMHLHGIAATAALYGACALDAGLGLLTLARPGRRLWLAQFALVAGYTAAIALALPAQFAEPFGPLIKNVPILAILFLLIHESDFS